MSVADKKYSVYFDQTSSVIYFLMFQVIMETTVGLVTTRPIINISGQC